MIDYPGIYNAVLLNFGLLIIRIVIGLIFVGHGAQKLFGWFGGYGPTGTGQWLESIGIQRGRVWAVAAGIFEFVGGLLFAAGLLTPVGAGLIIVVMIDAIITVHAKNGFWVSNNGIEYPFVLITVALAVGIIGPGQYVLIP